MKTINGKIYEVCGVCGEIIRWDKPIIGSMHICLSDERKLCETQQQFKDWQANRVKKSMQQLYC